MNALRNRYLESVTLIPAPSRVQSDRSNTEVVVALRGAVRAQPRVVEEELVERPLDGELTGHRIGAADEGRLERRPADHVVVGPQGDVLIRRVVDRDEVGGVQRRID